MITSLRRPIGRGEPLSDDEPKTIPDLFRLSVAKFDLSNALNYKLKNDWLAISSSDLLAEIEKAAKGLIDLGLNKGDRAAIFASNSPKWTIADAACQFAGIVDVPIYTTLATSSIAYILNDSASRLLFIENREMYDRIAEIVADCTSLEKLVFFDPDGIDGIDKAISFIDLLSTETSEPVGLSDPQPEDVATLIYTSGTTGEPKGVMLTHANIISNVIDAGEKYEFSLNDKCLSVLPLSHIFERSAMYLYIFNGMRIYYAESIDKAAENLSEVKPTILVGVPRIFEKVYAKAKLRAAQAGGFTETVFDWAINVAKEYASALGENG